MNSSILSFNARATASDLNLKITFDDHTFYDQSLPGSWTKITHRFDDGPEIKHLLTIEMTGKTWNHTQISDSGKIIQDCVIEITDFSLDGIDLGYLFNQVAKYHHDKNGTVDPQIDQFFGTMGCNGHVKFRFSSPVYLWMLEHM